VAAFVVAGAQNVATDEGKQPRREPATRYDLSEASPAWPSSSDSSVGGGGDAALLFPLALQRQPGSARANPLSGTKASTGHCRGMYRKRGWASLWSQPFRPRSAAS
jgi:hypothetical protein